MIIQDSQSKNLSRIPLEFESSPLSKVIEELFKPLLDSYKKAYRDELLRLKVNRNNLHAHISANRPTNQILGHSEETLNWLSSFLSEEEMELSISTPYTILENADVLGGCAIFSDRSLNYLGALISIIRFAQEPEIRTSMELNIDKHLGEFNVEHPLI